MFIELILLFLVILIPLIFSKQVYYLNNSIIGRLLLIITILLLSMCRTYLALILIIIYICLSQINYDDYDDYFNDGNLNNSFREPEEKLNNNYDLLNIMNILNNNTPLSNVDIENNDEVINPYNENESNKKTIYNVDNIILT